MWFKGTGGDWRERSGVGVPPDDPGREEDFILRTPSPSPAAGDARSLGVVITFTSCDTSAARRMNRRGNLAFFSLLTQAFIYSPSKRRQNRQRSNDLPVPRAPSPGQYKPERVRAAEEGSDRVVDSREELCRKECGRTALTSSLQVHDETLCWAF